MYKVLLTVTAALALSTQWAHARAQVWRVVRGAPAHAYPLVREYEARRAWPAGVMPAAPRLTQSASNTVIELTLAADERLVGAGGWLVRGTRRATWCKDSYAQVDSEYFAVPLIISSRGYGLFVNCSGRVLFDCGASDEGVLRIEVPEPGLDVYVFRGRPHEITAAYTGLVGRPRHVPAWVLTPWFSRNSYTNAAEIDAVVARARTHGLSPGVVVLECWAESLQTFTFETNRFPDPAAWIAGMHSQDVRVVLWETPSLWTHIGTYATAVSNNYLVRNADGNEIVLDWLEGARKVDFRTPAARNWWRDLHRPLIAMGVDGFKTDGGERMPDPFFHNLHPYYYQKAVLDAFRTEGRAGVTFARAASPPCAGLSTFWAGDQEAEWRFLRGVVRSGLAAAAAGFAYWGHDIGGYGGTPSQELYLRWLQFGTFSPIMQLHGVTPREPWHFGARATAIARTYFALRRRLRPYLAATGSNVYTRGIPIMRPLAWGYPDRAEAWATDDTYLLGDALLVAPVLTPMPRAAVPRTVLQTPDGAPGLQCEYFANTSCSGMPAAAEVMDSVDSVWGQRSAWDPRITDRFSARWRGTIGPMPTSGVYTFTVACDDGARLWIDERLMIDAWRDSPLTEHTIQVPLTRGQRVSVRLEYYEQTGDAVCRLLWRPPGAEGVSRTVWLPPGTWVDAWSGARHQGPAHIQRPTALDETPVFIKARHYGAMRPIFPSNASPKASP